MKKILVIGNGGRENIICQKLKKSPQNPDIYNFATAINPDIKKIATEILVGDIMNNEEIQKFAKKIQPDFAIVGPDDPIGNGATNTLAEIGIKSFSPTKDCAKLETSKSFTRDLLKKYNINVSPDFLVSTKLKDENRQIFYDKFKGQIVIKADGLLGGKGVLVAGDHFNKFEEIEDFAKKSIEKFGRVVLEEKLLGLEFSQIFFVDGKTVLETPAIQDHKRAFVDDKGPNTGGMGTISDEHNSLPFLNDEDLKMAKSITKKTMLAVEKETGQKFIGLMFGGFMKTKNGIKLIEYNARFGDPEVFNILTILENDFLEICELGIKGELEKLGNLKFKKVATVLKYLCPKGYPTNSVRNVPIQISSEIKNFAKNRGEYFLASIAEENGEYLLKGSRAVAVIGKGGNFGEANQNCEELLKNFTGEMFYREDIGSEKYLQKKFTNFL